MGNDGTLNFDTKIDSSGFNEGLKGIGSVAKTGIGLTTKVLEGAVAGVTALGTAAAKVGSDFEAGMSQVQAISGASGEDLEKLKNKAKEMGATTKFSATESAEALNYMAMAGWKTDDMLGGLEGVMNLAAASGEDLATASDIVTDAMTALGMQASEAGHFSDVLAAAASNANTTVGGMGETFKYAGAMAGTLGYSVEDVALATGLMANAGIKGTMAGTSLNSIMTRLSTNTNGARDAIEELGVSFFNEDGSARSLTDVMGELREATADMTTEQKANFANTVAGTEAQKGLSAILNATEDDYNKLSAAIQNADGCASEMAETMQDNLQGQLTILQSGLEGLGISIYETFQDTAKDVVIEAQGMIQQLQDAFDEGGLDGIVSAVGNVLAEVVGKVAEAAPSLIEAAEELVSSFCVGLTSNPSIAFSAADLITTVVSAIFNGAGSMWSAAITLVGQLARGLVDGAPQMAQAMMDCIDTILWTAQEDLPDVILCGAEIIKGFAQGIAENVSEVATVAVQVVASMITSLLDCVPDLLSAAFTLFTAIVDAIPDVTAALLEALPWIISTIIDFLTTSTPQLLEGAIQLFTALIDAIPQIVVAITENLPQIITTIVNGLTTALPQILQASITLLMAIIKAIPQIVVAITQNLPQIITAIATGLGQAIPQIFTAAKDLLWQIITAIPDIVVGVGRAIPDIISGIVNGLIGGIGAVKDAALELGSGILNGIKSFFGINSPSTVMAEQGDYLVQGLINGLAEMPNQMMQTLDIALNNLTAWGKQMLSSIQNTVQNMVNSAEQVISQLPGKIWTWLVQVVTKTVAWGQQMLTTAKTAISNMISAIIQLMSTLPDKVWTWLVAVVTKVNVWAQQMLNAAKTAISNMISAIISLLSELPDKVKAKLDEVLAKVTAWASDMAKKGAEAAKGLADAVVNGLKDLPSQMVTIGSNIVNGIWSGISSGWDWLKNKVSDLAQSLLDSAKSALGINSPSKEFRDQVGKWIMPGLADGVEDTMPETIKAMKARASQLVAAMQGEVSLSASAIGLNAESSGRLAFAGAGTVVYADNSTNITDTFNTPTATPSEIHAAERQAFRNFVRGK